MAAKNPEVDAFIERAENWRAETIGLRRITVNRA